MQNIQNTYSRSKQKKVLTINDQIRALCTYWKNKLLGRVLDWTLMLIKKTSMLEWMLGKTSIEKIISVPIWTTILFEGFLPSSNFGHSQGKLVMQPWENGKNPDFRPNLDPLKSFFMGFTSTRCSKLSSFAIYEKTNEPNLKKIMKNLILGPILAQMWPPIFVSVCVCVCVWERGGGGGWRGFSSTNNYTLFQTIILWNLKEN